MARHIRVQGLYVLLAGLIASGAFAQRISDLPDFGDIAGDDAGDLNLSEFPLYCPGCAVHRVYSRNRSITADEVGDFFVQLTQASLRCAEVDGSPSVSPLDSILFDSADGFTVTDAGSEDARVDWAPVANQITLGPHTTGSYVATIADDGSNTMTVNGSGSETAAVTLRAVDVVCTDCFNETEIEDVYLLNVTDTFTGTMTVVGTVAATTVTGANVTSGADPGHTHTGGAISTDNIAEGNSKVEVVDLATGKVEVTIDGAIDWTFDPNVFRATNAAGPELDDEAASTTNPTVLPDRSLAGTGLGNSTAITGGAGVSVIVSSTPSLVVGASETGVLGRNIFKLYDSDNSAYLALRPPAIVTSNQTCQLEDDASFIPYSCVGDGTTPADEFVDETGDTMTGPLIMDSTRIDWLEATDTYTFSAEVVGDLLTFTETGGGSAYFTMSLVADQLFSEANVTAQDHVVVADGGSVFMEELDANGSNYRSFSVPDSVTGDRECELLGAATDRFIPNSCLEILEDGDVADSITASNYVLKAGDTMTGGLVMSDGVGNSPSLTLTQQTGTPISVTARDSDDATLVSGGAGIFEVRGDADAQLRLHSLSGGGTQFCITHAGGSGLFSDQDCDFNLDASDDDLTVDDDDPESINLEAASMATNVADDEVPVGTAANTLTYKAVPDCDTGKLLYDTTTNAFSCGTDLQGFGGGGIAEYHPDNYPPAGDLLQSDEFTSGLTLSWTARDLDSAETSLTLGVFMSSFLITGTGSVDDWQGATTTVPADSGQDWYMVAKVNPAQYNATTLGCGISLITGGDAATPTEINSMYLRSTSSGAAAYEHLDHDNYEFGGSLGMSTDVVSGSTSENLELATKAFYIYLGWIDATEDISAGWSWDGFHWRAMTSDTTVDGYPVASGIFSRDNQSCIFEWVRFLDTDVDAYGALRLKVGN